MAPDEQGLLEVKPAQLDADADWMHTTDLARIDADGFLWILGRADQAIIRGGFKVMPDDVRQRAGSPSRGAGCGGGRDVTTNASARPRSQWSSCATGATADADDLIEFLQGRLARYEIPTDDRRRRRHPPNTLGQARSRRRP